MLEYLSEADKLRINELFPEYKFLDSVPLTPAWQLLLAKAKLLKRTFPTIDLNDAYAICQSYPMIFTEAGFVEYIDLEQVRQYKEKNQEIGKFHEAVKWFIDMKVGENNCFYLSAGEIKFDLNPLFVADLLIRHGLSNENKHTVFLQALQENLESLKSTLKIQSDLKLVTEKELRVFDKYFNKYFLNLDINFSQDDIEVILSHKKMFLMYHAINIGLNFEEMNELSEADLLFKSPGSFLPSLLQVLEMGGDEWLPFKTFYQQVIVRNYSPREFELLVALLKNSQSAYLINFENLKLVAEGFPDKGFSYSRLKNLLDLYYDYIQNEVDACGDALALQLLLEKNDLIFDLTTNPSLNIGAAKLKALNILKQVRLNELISTPSEKDTDDATLNARQRLFYEFVLPRLEAITDQDVIPNLAPGLHHLKEIQKDPLREYLLSHIDAMLLNVKGLSIKDIASLITTHRKIFELLDVSVWQQEGDLSATAQLLQDAFPDSSLPERIGFVLSHQEAIELSNIDNLKDRTRAVQEMFHTESALQALHLVLKYPGIFNEANEIKHDEIDSLQEKAVENFEKIINLPPFNQHSFFMVKFINRIPKVILDWLTHTSKFERLGQMIRTKFVMGSGFLHSNEKKLLKQLFEHDVTVFPDLNDIRYDLTWLSSIDDMQAKYDIVRYYLKSPELFKNAGCVSLESLGFNASSFSLSEFHQSSEHKAVIQLYLYLTQIPGLQGKSHANELLNACRLYLNGDLRQLQLIKNQSVIFMNAHQDLEESRSIGFLSNSQRVSAEIQKIFTSNHVLLPQRLQPTVSKSVDI